MTTKNWISFKIKQIQSFFKYEKCLQKACQLFNILQQTLAPRLVHELIYREKQNKLLQLCGKKKIIIQNFEDTWRALSKSAKEIWLEQNPFIVVWLLLKSRFHV